MIGTIYPVDNKFVFMKDGLPINVVDHLRDMNDVILKLFKKRPIFINTLF